MESNHILASMMTLSEEWGENIVAAILHAHKYDITQKQFVKFCDITGSDNAQAILSGIEAIWPEVYTAIPAYMGAHAFENLCLVLELLGVRESANNV